MAVAAAEIRDIVVAVVCIATEDDVVGTATDGTVHNQKHTALIHINHNRKCKLVNTYIWTIHHIYHRVKSVMKR